MGIVTSIKDHCYKNAVQVKFGRQKPVSVNKDFICVNTSGNAGPDQQSTPTSRKRKRDDPVNPLESDQSSSQTVESSQNDTVENSQNETNATESEMNATSNVTRVNNFEISVNCSVKIEQTSPASPEITELASWDSE